MDDSGGEELQIKKKYFVAKTVGKLKKKNSLAKTDTGAYKIPCFYQYSQMTKEQKEIEFHWPVMKVKAVGRFHEFFSLISRRNIMINAFVIDTPYNSC